MLIESSITSVFFKVEVQVCASTVHLLEKMRSDVLIWPLCRSRLMRWISGTAEAVEKDLNLGCPNRASSRAAMALDDGGL